MGENTDLFLEGQSSESKMLVLPPEQAPLADQDLSSSSYELGSVSEVLQGLLFVRAVLPVTLHYIAAGPYYKWE